MTDRTDHRQDPESGDALREPLPRGWLPEPLPGDNHPYWEAYVGRIMGELEPRMAARGAAPEPRANTWVSEFGDRWAAAALIAAASVAALMAVGLREPAMGPTPSADDLALTLLASGGDPALLWERLGIPADPVLARLTFEGAAP